MNTHVVVGTDVAVHRPRWRVAEGEEQDVDVEHSVEVGKYLGTVLSIRAGTNERETLSINGMYL